MSNPNPPFKTATRPVGVSIKPDGTIEGETTLSPTSFGVRAEMQIPPMRIIPVILVPGIMGSNLRKVNNHRVKVWAPPNSGWQKAKAGKKGVNQGAAERQSLMVPEEAEVDPDGPIEPATGMSRELARQRGWGTVHLDSYGGMLSYLQENLNKLIWGHEPHWRWQQLLEQQDAQHWGAQKAAAFDKLTFDELKKANRASYPVYAVGYNWLKSNNDSARYLKQRIEEIIAEWKAPYQCKQVLIVTHSMGGLVTRRCSQLCPDKILGVVHGVLPAMGAAAVYKRMRAGFEGGAAAVLGWNEAEVTASVANAIGPLELLPQRNYNQGKPWLHLQARGKVQQDLSLPKQDPYAEIYQQDAKTCWYGLVNSDLIDPAELYRTAPAPPWAMYIRNLKLAQQFHSELGDHYHEQTRAHYGGDKKQLAWGHVTWSTEDLKQQQDLMHGAAPHSDGEGEIDVQFKQPPKGIHATFEVSKPDMAGDGTVPGDASGHAPTYSPQVQQCYRLTGFDHQHSYNHETVRFVTLHSLIKQAIRSSLLLPPMKQPGPL